MYPHNEDNILGQWRLNVQWQFCNMVRVDEKEGVKVRNTGTLRRKITFDIAYSAVTGSADITAAE